jgi:hypothetical protein
MLASASTMSASIAVTTSGTAPPVPALLAPAGAMLFRRERRTMLTSYWCAAVRSITRPLSCCSKYAMHCFSAVA